MRKVIRLTERDLTRIVKRTIKEMEEGLDDIEIDFSLFPRLDRFRIDNEPEKNRKKFLKDIKSEFENEIDPFDEMDTRERKIKISVAIDNYLNKMGY